MGREMKGTVRWVKESEYQHTERQTNRQIQTFIRKLCNWKTVRYNQENVEEFSYSFDLNFKLIFL